MKKRNVLSLLKRTSAGILGTVMVMNGCQIPAVAASAKELGVESIREQIISSVGNTEMRALGEAVEAGNLPQVSDEDTPEGNGTTYYVDSENGDDSYDGTSEATAWKSIDKVNEKEYQPGDRILFKAGGEWEDKTLHPLGSGEEGNPIILSSYGEGNMPKISANGKVNEAVLLMNQEYWDISNLDISNTVEGLASLDYIKMQDSNGEQLGDLRGLRVAGQDAGQLDGYDIHNLYVHDVTGEDRWIGGSGTVGAGITKGNGWDKSKRTGGIIFEICQPETAEPTTFNDITIEENIINNNSFGGIVVKQWKGDKVGTNELWASREEGKNNAPSYECDNWKPHTNITIQDNYLSQKDSDYACNTIYLTSTKDAVVQRNVSREAGTCGIELYYTDDITVQYNEVFDTRVKAGGADSNAIDPDKGSSNALIQYNYIHDTGDGILLCGFVFGSSVVRYNVIQDAEKRYLNPHGDKGVNYIYNNIFYNSKDVNNIPFVSSSGGNSKYLTKPSNMHYFYNNIFYNASSKVKTVEIGEGEGTFYDRNCYYGTAVQPTQQDENAIVSDPKFVNNDLSGAKDDISKLSNIQLSADSPLIGAGKVVENDERIVISLPQEVDMMGNAVEERADIGVMQFQTAEGQGIINGYVSDQYGYKIADAQVSLGEKTAKTDENGFYSFGEVDADTYELIVSKELYEDGQPVNVTLEEKNVAQIDLVLGESHSTVGSVSGIVRSGTGGIPDATVTVSKGNKSYETVTDESGAFLLNDVPVDQGYTVKAEKEGYIEAQQENVDVRPAGITSLELILSKDNSSTVYAVNEDFNSYEIGTFSGNDMWTVLDPGSSKGSIEIKEENGEKYLYMNKTASGTIGLYNKNSLSLEGIITIEARVKRMNNGGNANQFGMYSYNDKDWKASNPASSANPMATFALSKGSIITHNVKGSSSTVSAKSYNTDQWYIIRNIVNLDTGTFDFYVDDMEVPVLKKQPLRTVNSQINRLLFFENGSNTGDICIDYFRVCTGTAYDYNDAALAGVEIENVEITQVDETTYKGNVTADTESIKITPKANSPFAKATVNGDVYDGSNPIEVSLQEGENAIAVIITAEDGTTKEYTLIVERENGGALAYLTAMKIQETELSPEFASDILEYRAQVGANVGSIHFELTPVGNAVISKITVNGTSQNTNTEVDLVNGVNTIEIEVASQDGTNYETYVVTVTKEDSKVDKRTLDALFTMIEGLNPEDYSTDTWNVLNEKIEAANKVKENASATQEEVDAACAELIAAINGLESGLNTVAAEQFIIQAEAILEEAQNDPNKYRPADIQAITDALEPVKAAVEAGTVTQEELNTLAMELLDKLNNLRDQVEADVLETMISLVEQILENKDKYTSDSIKDLETALQEAKEVVENGDRTQEQIGNAYENLNTAIAGLEIRGNKDVLKPLLEKAEEIQKNSSKYESTSLDGLEEAAKTAQLVYDNPDALQKEINEAATKLAEQLAQVRIVGDVNADGVVNTADAAIILKANAELTQLDETQSKVADVTGDQMIDTKDAAKVQQYAAEMISEF